MNTRNLTQDDTAQHGSDPGQRMGSYAPSALQRFLIGLARRTILHRGKFRHWMTNRIMGLGRPLDVTFRDCRFRIEGRNNLIEYGLLLHPGYNGAEIDFLLAGLPQGGTAVDIGCNIGLYSLPLARRAGPDGTVVSIDANAAMIDRITFNASGSDLTNLAAVHTAVGDETGFVDLEIRKDDVAIVSVRKSDTGRVPIAPLAQVLAQAGVTQVHALKIDIEGFEDAALVPYLDSATAAMRPDRIVIEHPERDADYPGCAAAFARHGYVLQGRTRANSLYLHTGDTETA